MAASGLRAPGESLGSRGISPERSTHTYTHLHTFAHTYTHLCTRTSVIAGAVTHWPACVRGVRGHRMSRREGGEGPRHPGWQVESSCCPSRMHTHAHAILCSRDSVWAILNRGTRTPVHPYTRTPVHPCSRTPVHPYTRDCGLWTFCIQVVRVLKPQSLGAQLCAPLVCSLE